MTPAEVQVSWCEVFHFFERRGEREGYVLVRRSRVGKRASVRSIQTGPPARNLQDRDCKWFRKIEALAVGHRIDIVHS